MRELTLLYLDWTKEAIVKANVHNLISASVFLKYDQEGILHPIIFFSIKNSLTGKNYKIYYKELMAIISAF